MHISEKSMAAAILHMSGVDTKKCMKCGKCSGTCPAFDTMDIHPHQFVSMVDDESISVLLESESLWHCFSCFACAERCPRGVEPAKLIEAARLTLIRRQGCNHLRPEEIPRILNDEIPQQAIVSAFRKYSK
jgi:heterodisulfide reductase subunit C